MDGSRSLALVRFARSARVLVLLGAAACTGDDAAGDEDSPRSGDECPGLPCSQVAPQCRDEATAMVCMVTPDGCSTLQPKACGAGSTCQNGACTIAKVCEGACCRDCELTTCGSESDDGCGGNCGGASSAAAMCQDVITAICAQVDPCCEDSAVPCPWNGMRGCVDHYSLLWDCTGLWCDDAVDTCLRELEDARCSDRELPMACQLLANATFEVLGQANLAGTPPDATPDGGMDSGTAPMRCVGTAPSCQGRDRAACAELASCKYFPPHCQGALTRCETPTTQEKCTAESFLCSWLETCEGSTRTCAEIPLDLCAATPGCMLEAQ